MKALVVIDYINEITHPEGKLSGKGYTDFIKESDTFTYLNDLILRFREEKNLIIFVKVAFKEDYSDHPTSSPLFGKAKEFNALQNDTWATEFNGQLGVQEDDLIVTKNRVDAFHNTDLLEILRQNNITDVHIAGVATDLAVEAVARTAHDNDFLVTIESQACAAANKEDHENSLATMSKIAVIK